MKRLKSPVSKLGAGLLSLILFFSAAIPAQAAFNTAPAEVGTWTYFMAFRDEYRTDFGMPPPSMWDTLIVYFETPSSTPYTTEFEYEDVKSKVMYLNCNGTYQFQYFKGSTMIAWSGLIETNLIVTPTCASYPDGGGANALNADYDPLSGGGYEVSFDGLPGAAEYEVYEDGQLVDTIPAGGGGPYSYETAGGSVTIIAKDGSGNVIGQSDLQVPDFVGWDSCSVCSKLLEILSCPGWNEIMGDLRETLAGAIRDVLGDVPAPPSIGDIENMIIPEELPELEIDFAGDDLMPVMPEMYDDPLPTFDITDGPQIDIVDNSTPFVIAEPNAKIDSDDPGVMVFPGDPRNSSNGIKQPEEWESPYPVPVPTVSEDDPEIPVVEIPVPGIEPSDIPTPGGGGDTSGPVPGLMGGDGE